MKMIIYKNVISKYILGIIFIGLSMQSFSQCDTETFTVVDWCENSYAEWTISNPDPLAQYHWYEPVYAANGTTVIDTIDRGYGINASGSHFVSPYRYTTPSPVPSTAGWDERKFWYVKEKSVNFSLGQPITGAHSIAPAAGYTMNFTSTLETTINFVTIPVFSYYISPTLNFYVQIQIDSKYSQLYYFNATNLTSIGGNTYVLRVPVNIATQAGTHVMTVVTNPASPQAGTVALGTNQVELAMLNAAATFPINNTAGINVTGSSNTGRSMIYKWETSTYCPYKFSEIAKKETNLTKCCTPVTAALVVSSSNPIIVSGTDNSILTVTAYTSSSNYFQWYKDGNVFGAGAPGKTSITVTAPGSYSVREVQDPTRLNNVSCYSEAFSLIQERTLFAKVNNPKASYCVGDEVTIEAYGSSIGPVTWSPASLAVSPNSKITQVKLSTPGTLTFTATSDVFPDDLIANGDFEDGNNGSFQTSMTYVTPPNTPSTNQYTINDYVPNQSYWNTNNPFNIATQTRGDGNFFISDAPTAAGSLLWKETVTVSSGKEYTFSIDHVNISWNADASNTARIADNDLEFDVFVNGTIYGSFKTDGRGQNAGVGRWKTDGFIWNSGGSTQAVIEIKTKNTALPGYDFGFDNIKFGGPQTQTAKVSIGPIADCFDIIATQSACIGPDKTLSAKGINTVTGEEIGVIDRWEIIPGNTLAGIGKTITVSPLVTTTYVVYGYFPGGNLIQNGDFELGVNGFNYGTANNLYNAGNGPGSIAVLKNPKVDTNNDAYATMGDHTSGTGNMLLVDPGSADGNIISYNFNANAGQNYLFSLWAANAVDFTRNPNGISASLSFIINGPGVTNLQISSIDLPRNNVWIQLSDVWKPATTGAYTLTVRAKGDATLAPLQSAATGQSISGGNDYVLDDIVLAEPTSKVYTDTITVTPCISCTQPTTVAITAPAAATHTICQGSSVTLSGTVTVPAVSTATGGYKYSWIKMSVAPAPNVVLQTAAIAISPNTATPVPNYITLTGALSDAGKYILRVEDGTTSSSACFRDDTLTLIVNATTVPGAIAAAQIICSGTAPAALTGSASTGGVTLKNYKWERSATSDTGPWTSTAAYSTTATGFTPGVLTATTYYRRIDSSGVCAGMPTNVIQITVDPLVTAAVISADQSICSGAAPSQIGGPVATGGSATATASYVWEVSTTSATTGFTAVSGAVLKDYTPGTLSAATWYRRIDKKGTCSGVASNAVKISIVAVAPATVILAQSPAGTICAGTNVTFTASVGNGGIPSYVWSSSVSGTLAATGNTYSSSTLVNGEIITVDIESSLSCANPKTATASSTMVVTAKVTPTVAIAASKTTICPSESVNFSISSQANGGTAPNGPTYQWRKNSVNIANATNATYTAASPITDGDVFDLVMTTGLTCVTSATATSTPAIGITVTPVPTLGVTITADKTSICANNPVVYTATLTGTGTTPAPTYEWFITSAATATGGISQGAAGTTANTFTTSALTASNNKVYVRVVSNAACAGTTPAASNVVSVTVNTGITAGSIGSDQTICYNTVPANLTQATASDAATATYVWEASLNGTSGWNPVPGSGTGYSFPAVNLTGDVYIRRVVTDGSAPAPCNVATSKIVHITVNPALVAGVIEKDEQICSGLVPAAMTQVTAPTGGTGTYTYQWQSADLTGPFSNIPGATASGYTSAALMTTKRFQRVETSGGCGSVISNIVTKEIIEKEIVTAQINDPGQVCAIPTAVTFTAATTGGGTLTYAWTLGGQPAGTNSNTYSYMPVSGDNGKKVQVTVSTSIGCNAGPGISNAVTLDIVASALPAVTITGSPLVQCAGLPVKFTVSSTTAGGSNPSYQWFVQNAAGVSTAVAGATNTNFTSLDLNPGDKVYVELSSNLVCALGSNPHKSNVIAVTILPAPAPAINETPVPVCTPDGFPFTATVGSGTPPTTLQWYKDGIAISGATGSGYTAYESGSYSVEETNEACGTISTEVALTVIQRPEANAGSDVTVKEGDEVILNGSGGAVYSWTPDTGLDDVHSSTPKLTADKTITYVLTVTDATGQCSDDDEVTVFVERPIRVPNVITVNGDGVNDTWEIENIESFPNAEFLIYNRWGNLVWKSTGYPKEWDATNFRNGEVLPDGTYFYIIELHSTIYTEAYTGYIQVVK